VGKEFSQYQKKLINRYYANLDTMMLQKLQELVTELYLAETEKEKAKLWERAHKAMMNLKIAPEDIANIMQGKNVVTLAKQVEEWLKPTGKR
jgi:hypothetical protein